MLGTNVPSPLVVIAALVAVFFIGTAGFVAVAVTGLNPESLPLLTQLFGIMATLFTVLIGLLKIEEVGRIATAAKDTAADAVAVSIAGNAQTDTLNSAVNNLLDQRVVAAVQAERANPTAAGSPIVVPDSGRHLPEVPEPGQIPSPLPPTSSSAIIVPGAPGGPPPGA